MAEPGSSSHDDLLAALRARVGERRQSGLYPPGLEEELDLHFHHIAVRAVRDRMERLRSAFVDADAKGLALGAERIAASSRNAVGSAVHKTVARLVSRQIEGVLTQVREYTEALADAHRAQLLAYADLVSQLDDLRDRFLAADGIAPEGARVAADLELRLATLEEMAARRAPRVWPDPGDVPESPERWASLAAHIPNGARVLAGGPGGLANFLEASTSVIAVEGGGDLASLASRIDDTIDAVVLATTLERVAPFEQLEFAVRCARSLRAGARVVLEVRNPETLLGPMPDAVAPSHPAYLAFVFREAGFDVDTHWHGGGAGALEDDVDAEIRRLAEAVFGFRMFTLVAVKR